MKKLSKNRKGKRKMSEFKKIMNELKTEKQICILLGEKEKAQKINEKMVILIDQQTKKEKSLSLTN